MASLGIPLLSAGLQGLAGLFGSRPQTSTVTGKQDTNNTTSYQYTPQQQQMLQQLMSGYQSQLSGTDLSGYQTSGIKSINDADDASQTAIQNMLAQRGLSYSPAAVTSQTQARVAQAGQQSNFLNQLPLLQYQMKTQALQGAGQFLNGQHVNTNTTGETQSSGTQTGSGNMLGGLFAGIGSGIAGTLGKKFANQS